MPDIRLVERLGNLRPIDKEAGVWESGYWVISEETAEKLVGGNIYLHSGQTKPSHFGGRILTDAQTILEAIVAEYGVENCVRALDNQDLKGVAYR